MKTYIAPAYNSHLTIDDGAEYFLGKLIKKITNKVTAPTLKKVNTAIAQSGASDATKEALTRSATSFQKAIVEDSPAGALKGVALAASVVTLGASSAITATGLAKVAAAGTAAFRNDGAVTETQQPADVAAEFIRQQEAEQQALQAEADKQATTNKIIFGAIMVVLAIILIAFAR